MTTATMTTVHPAASPARRIWNVVRLHLANPWTTLFMPWIIFAMIFVANWAIAWILSRTLAPQAHADATDGMSWNGGSLFLFVYMLVVAVQAISITFPFALGYGVTRRDFYLGSSLTFLMLSAGYSLVMGLFAVAENATSGWGVGLHMFTAPYFGDGSWWQRLLIYFVLYLFFFFVGSAMASVWVRWKAKGVATFFIVLSLVVVGGAMLLTITESWGAIGSFFGYWGMFGSFMWLLVPAAVSFVVGFLLLRRATPQAP